MSERTLSLARQNGQGILSALQSGRILLSTPTRQSVAPHNRATLTNAISCYNGRVANNPYGNEVLQILDSAEKQNNKRLAKARAKNYFKAEKQKLFVKVMQ